jgi:hypothetical protein
VNIAFKTVTNNKKRVQISFRNKQRRVNIGCDVYAFVSETMGVWGVCQLVVTQFLML